MRPRRHFARSWPAAWAALALLVQALIPGAALASQRAETMVMCTAQGAMTVSVDHEDKGFAGLPCQQCVAVAAAAIDARPVVSIPVRYAAPIGLSAQTRREPAALPRAPPRPPGQAPPFPTA